MAYKEIWAYITEGGSRYLVSDAGNVKSHESGLIAKYEKSGYNYVNLYYNGKNHTRKVATLVARAFVENPGGYETVRHLDFNLLNDKASNLYWAPRCINVESKLCVPVVAKSVSTNKVTIHASVRHAALTYGLSRQVVSKHLQTGTPTATGYIFKRVIDLGGTY